MEQGIVTGRYALSQWGGLFGLVVVLALVTGVASGATVSEFPAADDTNTSIGLSDTINDTSETVNATTDLSTSTGTSTITNTTAVVQNLTSNTTTTIEPTTPTVKQAVDEADRPLTASTRLLASLGRETPTALDRTTQPLVSTESKRAPAASAPHQTVGDHQSSTAAVAAPAVPTISDVTPGAAVAATGAPAAASERPGTGMEGGQPTPATGVAVGVQAVLAGVVLRDLAGLPAPAQAVAATGHQLLDRLPRVIAPLRYSRYDESDPLAHEARAAVVEAVTDSPGVSLTELTEQTDVTLSTLRHHVRVLENEGLIVAARVRNHRRFYPTGTEDFKLGAALNDEATAPIVAALASQEGLTVSELAEAVNRNASTVTHHLQNLEADGLVIRERESRTIVNRLAPAVRDALASRSETAADPGPESDAGANTETEEPDTEAAAKSD